MSFYSDLGKSSADLFKKDFPDGSKTTVEVNTRATSGATFLFRAKRNADNSVSGTLEPTIKCADRGLELSGSISNDKCKWTLSHADKLRQGLTLKAGCDCVCKDSACNSSLSAEAKFKNENGGATAVVTFPGDSANTSIDVSGLFKKNQVAVGASATYAMGNVAALTKSSAGIQYTKGDFVAAGAVNAEHKDTTNFTVVASYFHKLSSRDAQVSGAVAYNVAKKSVCVKAAGRVGLADNAYAKARIDSCGRAAFAYSAELGPNARITLASEADVVNCCSDNSKAPTFSVNINLHD